MADDAIVNSDLSRLVRTAIRTNASSIADLLKCIAEQLSAFGCVLWGVVPGTDLEATAPDGKLFVQAAWFPTKELFAMHNLPLKYTTGQVLVHKKARRGIAGEPGIDLFDHPFLSRHQVQKVCSVPLTFLEGGIGALTAYRSSSMPPFSADDENRMHSFASILPQLCQAVHNKLSLDLLSRIEIILQECERNSQSKALPKAEKRVILQRICEEVKVAFHCLEVSMFLEDRLEVKGAYVLQATTREKWVLKREYKADEEEGLDGWVLARRQPLKLFDLIHFDPNDPAIQKDYPGLKWKDPLKVRRLTLDEFDVQSDAEKPPFSFMAAPCLMGADLVGVIRCLTATRGPFYFSHRELGLLELVAAQVAQSWFTWMNRREVQQENESWQKLVRGMGELNDSVQRELEKGNPSQSQIFDQTLELIRKALPGADINDARLLDEKRRELYFATTPPLRADEEEKKLVREGWARRYPVDEVPPRTLGAEAYQKGEVLIITDVTKHPHYRKIFPEVKRMIIAPIKVGDRIFGVLDIRSAKLADFPSNAESITALVGRQLGLFLHLAKTVANLRKAEADAKASEELQARIFQDFAHQIKTPINQALGRASSASYLALDGESKMDITRIRGLCRKASRVIDSVGFLADLSFGRAIKLRKTLLDYGQFMKLAIEAAQDHEVTADSTRKIQFLVERSSFVASWPKNFTLDQSLLEQALNNLLDNASKYSFEGTEVVVYGGIASRGHFFISVSNVGLRIHRSEIPNLIQRRFRTAGAEAVTQEGSGIGLWIVDNIMKAHGGELLIIPTKADGRTEFRLLFPTTQ